MAAVAASNCDAVPMTFISIICLLRSPITTRLLMRVALPERSGLGGIASNSIKQQGPVVAMGLLPEPCHRHGLPATLTRLMLLSAAMVIIFRRQRVALAAERLQRCTPTIHHSAMAGYHGSCLRQHPFMRCCSIVIQIKTSFAIWILMGLIPMRS